MTPNVRKIIRNQQLCGTGKGIATRRTKDSSTLCQVKGILVLVAFLVTISAYSPVMADLFGEMAYLDLSDNPGQIEVLPTQSPSGIGFLELPEQSSSFLTLDTTAPTARFTADPTSGRAPLTVRFRDQSPGNPTRWEWNFGDGGSSSGQNPVYIYNTPGTYTASLRVSNLAGSDSRSIKITVTEMPSPRPLSPGIGYLLTPTPTPSPTPSPQPTPTVRPAMGSLVTPTPTPVQPGIGALPTPTKTPAPGIAYVNPDLIPDAPEDFTDIEIPGYSVDPELLKKTKPGADFSYVQGQGSNLLAVRFYDESTGTPNKWSWDFGDGQTSKEQNPVHAYMKAGVYDVFLDASNSYGTSMKWASVSVDDRPNRVEAKFDAKPETGPAPLTVQFIDKSSYLPTKYLWAFGDGYRSDLQNPVHTYEKEGTYWVSLDVSTVIGKDLESGKPSEVSSSYIKQITVTGQLKASFTADPMEGTVPLSVRFTDTSVGDPTSWLWNFGDGKTSTDKNPSHTYTAHNTKGYPVTLTIKAPGTADSATSIIKTVASSRPQALFIASCVPDTPTIGCYFEDRSTNSPTSWLWDFGDGTKSFDQYPIHRYSKEGNYTVTLTAGNPAGIGTYSKEITVQEKKLV